MGNRGCAKQSVAATVDKSRPATVRVCFADHQVNPAATGDAVARRQLGRVPARALARCSSRTASEQFGPSAPPPAPRGPSFEPARAAAGGKNVLSRSPSQAPHELDKLRLGDRRRCAAPIALEIAAIAGHDEILERALAPLSAGLQMVERRRVIRNALTWRPIPAMHRAAAPAAEHAVARGDRGEEHAILRRRAPFGAEPAAMAEIS